MMFFQRFNKKEAEQLFPHVIDFFKSQQCMFYCLKCKKKTDDPNAMKIILKNGRPAMQGKCPDCGTKMTRILKSKQTE